MDQELALLELLRKYSKHRGWKGSTVGSKWLIKNRFSFGSSDFLYNHEVGYLQNHDWKDQIIQSTERTKYIWLLKLENLSFFQKAYCSMFAGFIGSLVGNPPDLALVRMQADARLPQA